MYVVTEAPEEYNDMWLVIDRKTGLAIVRTNDLCIAYNAAQIMNDCLLDCAVSPGTELYPGLR